MKTLINFIKREIKRRNISQNQFAVLCGIQPGTLSNIMIGKRGAGDKILRQLAIGTGYEFEEIDRMVHPERYPLFYDMPEVDPAELDAEEINVFARFEALAPDQKSMILRLLENIGDDNPRMAAIVEQYISMPPDQRPLDINDLLEDE